MTLCDIHSVTYVCVQNAPPSNSKLVHGNLLRHLPSGLTVDLIEVGFAMSLIVSFPLAVGPFRDTLFLLLEPTARQTDGDKAKAVDPMPTVPFIGLTACICARMPPAPALTAPFALHGQLRTPHHSACCLPDAPVCPIWLRTHTPPFSMLSP